MRARPSRSQSRSALARGTVAAAALAVVAATESLASGQRRAPRAGVAAMGPLFHGGDAPVDLGGSAPRGLRGVRAEDCAACHAQIAREWRASLHAASFTDAVFQDGYARERRAFCRNCHAPLVRARDAEPDAIAAAEGVSCAVCHVREGRVLGAAGRGQSAHPVLATPQLATSAYCAGCHQFDFPDGARGGVRVHREPMQRTFDEWRASAAAARGEQCQHCHMPYRTDAVTGQRYRSHAFPGVRDAGLMARAVRIEVVAASAARRGGGSDAGVDVALTARIEPGAIGHAFPTGDLFRQSELVAWIDGADEADDPSAEDQERGARAAALFTRRYASVAARTPRGGVERLRHQVGDTRVGPGARAVTLRLRATGHAATAASTVRVRWALEHLRMPGGAAAMHGFAPSRNRTRVASGVVVVAVSPRPRGSATRRGPPPRGPVTTRDTPTGT